MKYEYMKESEQMLQYFQFPKFLLKLRISQTAKFLYMILYDRARISRKNSWIDKYGNVYLIFPIDELSVQIDKCKSSVKTALKELDDVGLLVRRSGGFMGMKKHSRQCACDRKAYEEEQKYFKDKEHRELVSRNTSICFDESRMEEWTFENADMSDTVMHRAKKYVDNWEEMKRNHIGCLFWGPVGTGKSFIAGCIANELLKQEVMVKMTNFNTIIDDIFPLADKTEYINALASYQLLIIDDLGVERNSEYALGIIFSVIDRRIRSGRPLIITTNLPLKEIKNETMLDKRRIYDRILEMCTSMYVGGTSKREVIASMKMEKAKTLLNTNRGEEDCE